MRLLLFFHCVILDIILLVECGSDNNNNNESYYSSQIMKYEPNWESLDTRPLPQWYDNAKVGIFIHWGVYSVPSFGSEWFWINWQGSHEPNYEEFIRKNYKPNFTYQDFAHDFTAELFNATEWALLFRDSGARYVVLTSKHHDGFCLWPSSRSFSWNSVDIGPKIDVIKHLSTAIRENTSLKFGLYYSLFEWFNRMYIDDKLHAFLRNNYVMEKMLPELRELVTEYLPEIIWSDGDWEATSKYWQSEEFIAWLYNDSPVAETVVTNDRWGIGVNCLHGDFRTCSDRYNPGVLQSHKWENCFTLDKTSWGQRFDTNLKDYMTSEELIKEIVSTVSCGGNVLVNVGPTKYGTILPIFEERLRDMGDWLRMNGEAIYGSRPWAFQNDTITPGIWYTSKSGPGSTLNVFAIVVDYPYKTNEIEFGALRGQIKKNSIKISLIGMENTIINWSLERKSLRVQFPPKNLIDQHRLRFAWTFKITISSF